MSNDKQQLAMQILSLLMSDKDNQAKPEPAMKTKDHGYQLVVMEKGFIYVGELSESDGEITIKDAKNLRKHRTGSGLGYVAMHPEHEEVIFDSSPDIKAPIASMILHMDAKRA